MQITSGLFLAISFFISEAAANRQDQLTTITTDEDYQKLFPSHVSLIDPTSPGVVICSGTLVSTKLTLTLRYCVDGLSEVQGIFGVINSPGAQTISFSKQNIFTNIFVPTGGLVLLWSSEDIGLTDYVKPVFLPKVDIFFKFQDFSGFMGYWKNNEVQYEFVKFAQTVSEFPKIPGYPLIEAKDSGGPIVYVDENGRQTLVAIFSGSTSAVNVSYYVSIEPYFDWIVLQIQFDLGL